MTGEEEERLRRAEGGLARARARVRELGRDARAALRRAHDSEAEVGELKELVADLEEFLRRRGLEDEFDVWRRQRAGP